MKMRIVVLSSMVVVMFLFCAVIASAQCSSGYQPRGHLVSCCGTHDVVVSSCVIASGSHCNFLGRYIECTSTCFKGTATTCTAADAAADALANMNSQPFVSQNSTDLLQARSRRLDQPNFVEAGCVLTKGNKYLLSATDQILELGEWLKSHPITEKHNGIKELAKL